jgi:hypothetical protein
MIYSKEEITQVLWNVFIIYAKDIKFLERVGDEYWFNVITEDYMTIDKLNDIGSELENTELFDVINKGKNELLIKYIGESEILNITEMRKLNETLKTEYIEFNDGQINRNKKLYSFLPNNVANTNFVQFVYKQMLDNKRLTKNQWDEFKYILDNGKSKYNNNKLTTKN